MAIQTFVNEEVEFIGPAAVPPEEEEVTEPTTTVEFDYTDDDGEDAPAQAVATRESEIGEEVEDEDPRYSALQRELADVRRATAELRNQQARLSAAPGPAIPDVPPHVWETIDLGTPDGVRALNENLSWQRKKDLEGVRSQVSIDAAAVASEQRARGILNKDAVGAGYGYDEITGRYTAQLKEENPAFRDLLMRMRDPSLAEYGLGVVLAALEKFKGDPVKAFKAMRNGIEGKTDSTNELVEKIQKGAESGAKKIRQRARQVGQVGKGGRITAQFINDMDLDQFQKMFPNSGTR